jgi:hypothetical protein
MGQVADCKMVARLGEKSVETEIARNRNKEPVWVNVMELNIAKEQYVSFELV